MNMWLVLSLLMSQFDLDFLVGWACRFMSWYVVWVGRHPGVYRTWPECHSQVHGFSGACYRKFPTQKEALRAFNERLLPPTVNNVLVLSDCKNIVILVLALVVLALLYKLLRGNVSKE